MRKRNYLVALITCLSLNLMLTGLMKASGQTVIFFFVAPNNVIASTFGGALDAQFCPGGYSKVEVTSSNLAKFNSVAPPNIKYVYTQLQGSTPLRTNVNLVFQNSGGAVTRIFYLLVDDRTALATTRGIFTVYKDNGATYVWPAASNGESPVGSKKFVGAVMLGEHQLDVDQSKRAGGIKAVDEVVLHETSHTQWTGSFSKWDGVSGPPITYGADGTHYFSFAELLGDQEAAMNEGLATFYGLLMNDDGLQKLMGLYTSLDNRYFVEAQSVLAGTSGLSSVKTRISTVLQDVNHVTKLYDSTGEPINIFTYKWWEVPAWYLLFAESTSTAFFSIMRNHSYQNKDVMFDMIRYTAFKMSADRKMRFLTYACNRLALRMEQYNNGSGQADGSKISSLFPFAVLDLLTHFSMSDAEYQNDYNRNNVDEQPKAYKEYFARRNAIGALVQPDIAATPIRFNEALEKIKNYCRQPGNMF
jgi:hypothetical protein